MGFDFASQLSLLYPGQEYEITVMTGGLVNHTIRATRIGNSKPGTGDGPDSAILKYAPPYVASIGEAAPFPQDRQLTEASALAILGNRYVTSGVKGIKIPRTLAHDSARSILVIEDLGPLMTLWDFLNHLSGDSIPHQQTTCATIGRRVGGFLAELHCQETAHRARRSAPADAAVLDCAHLITADLVLDAAVRPIRERLLSLGGLTEAETDALYARTLADFSRPNGPGESCLAMGDCHPGAILIDPTPAGDEGELPDIGVIDWEFAALHGGRGPNGDAAQLLASLHALLLSLPQGSRARENVVALAEAVGDAYSARAGYAGREALRSDPAAAAILRSALILHGRELINQAVERPWGDGGLSVAEMVAVGIWYLRRAGENVDGMFERNNWNALMGEEASLMLRLFGLYER